MGNFLRDLDRSREAVQAILDYLINKGFVAYELEGRQEQILGDIRCEDGDKVSNIEVKFDIMAAKTGNLCFEMSNGKKLTGIFTTEADHIYYVVPNKESKTVYVFAADKLKHFVQTSELIKVKSGGDKKKFILALAKITDIIEADVLERTFTIA